MDHRVLITGATSGIGEQLAHVFARHHRRLVLVARDPEKLKKTAMEIITRLHMRVDTMAVDLSQPDAAEKVKAFCDKNGYVIDTLVNNAGFGSFGTFHTSQLSNETKMVELNSATVMKLCRLFLPKMLEERHGQILNLSSIAAFQAGPYMATYTATKTFILSFSESLAAELHGTGVTVTALCPGPTDSHFASAAGIYNNGAFSVLPHSSTQQVAEYAYRKMMRGKVIAIPGLLYQFLAVVDKVTPRVISRRIVAALQRSEKNR
ncbi:MAG: SDR family oxidoreductase [Bifidobacteriaceae bacterium]|jgi:short-subunit dehydrogenase|nr:SDR family oxidoreductase [Bifidobacteriaceae bacterium]MCI1979559.1 SDR family oxidoreductase [Bifidobacteriaceae bacterium]